MERHEFTIKGSAEDPYQIVFTRAGGIIVGLCSCPAGQNGMACKHRLGILTGDKKICADLDTACLESVRSWLPGSAIALALEDLAAAEQALAEVQADIKNAKKRLSQGLLGRG